MQKDFSGHGALNDGMPDQGDVNKATQYADHFAYDESSIGDPFIT